MDMNVYPEQKVVTAYQNITAVCQTISSRVTISDTLSLYLNTTNRYISISPFGGDKWSLYALTTSAPREGVAWWAQQLVLACVVPARNRTHTQISSQNPDISISSVRP
jgi:hypothetical protein